MTASQPQDRDAIHGVQSQFYANKEHCIEWEESAWTHLTVHTHTDIAKTF